MYHHPKESRSRARTPWQATCILRIPRFCVSTTGSGEHYQYQIKFARPDEQQESSRLAACLVPLTIVCSSSRTCVDASNLRTCVIHHKLGSDSIRFGSVGRSLPVSEALVRGLPPAMVFKTAGALEFARLIIGKTYEHTERDFCPYAEWLAFNTLGSEWLMTVASICLYYRSTKQGSTVCTQAQHILNFPNQYTRV